MREEKREEEGQDRRTFLPGYSPLDIPPYLPGHFFLRTFQGRLAVMTVRMEGREGITPVG